MANLDINVARGADWSRTATIKDNGGTVVNLSTATFTGEVKVRSATDAVATATFTFTNFTNGTDGIIIISLPKEQTILLSKTKLYSYDIFATIGGKRYQMLWGRVILNPNVTTL